MTHLVNTNIQKHHPLFKNNSDDSHWEMKKFEEELIKEQNISLTEIHQKLYHPIKQISAYLFEGVKHLFNKYEGNFQIFGLDFMFDDQYKPYFIEVNEIPQLLGGTSTHSKVCPFVVKQQLEASFYANEQILKGEDVEMDVLKKKCIGCELLIGEDYFYLDEKAI